MSTLPLVRARASFALIVGCSCLGAAWGITGTEPDRSGPSLAIVVNDTAYLVDAGPDVFSTTVTAIGGHDDIGDAVLSNLYNVVHDATHYWRAATRGAPTNASASTYKGRTGSSRSSRGREKVGSHELLRTL